MQGRRELFRLPPLFCIVWRPTAARSPGGGWLGMDAPSSSGAGASNAPPAQPPLSPLSFCERLERDTKEDESFDPMFVVGICLAMLSALISSVALIIMKRSADIEKGPPFRVVRCAAPWLPAACLSAGCISAEIARLPARNRAIRSRTGGVLP